MHMHTLKHTHKQRRDIDGADKFLQEAVKANPEDPDVLDAYGEFLEKERKDRKNAAVFHSRAKNFK
jgi:Tfp pilus assembly protein PilF